ncbi:MAG: prohead protease, partial [Armatimonadetes bacterium CG17_big_fil_post_rev_8_21_14_2_50_66_6]
RTKKELIQQKFLADKTENILARSHTAKPSSLYQTLRDLSEEGLLYLMAITKKEQVRQAVSLFVTDLRKTTIALNGHDLKKMGYPEGPLFHKILQAVLDARLDGMVHNRSEETAFVEKKFAGLAKTARRTHSAL